MGRWVKGQALTPNTLRLIERLLKKGHFEKTVYKALSIPETTWSYWKREARKVESQIVSGEINESDLELGDIRILKLLRLTRMGRSKAVIANVNNILEAGKDPKFWKASAWYLEHIDDNYMPKQDITFNGTMGNFDIKLDEEEEKQFKANMSVMFPNLGKKEDK